MPPQMLATLWYGPLGELYVVCPNPNCQIKTSAKAYILQPKCVCGRALKLRTNDRLALIDYCTAVHTLSTCPSLDNAVREEVQELESERSEQSKSQEAINPKDFIGATKVPLSLVPFSAVAGMAMGLQVGGVKYGPFNWRDVPVQSHIYIEAAIGHCASYTDGEDIDPESGISHLYLALATIAIIIDGTVSGLIKDTRHTKGKKGAGSFSRSVGKLIGDPERIKEWLSKPYTKSIGVDRTTGQAISTKTGEGDENKKG